MILFFVEGLNRNSSVIFFEFVSLLYSSLYRIYVLLNFEERCNGAQHLFLHGVKDFILKRPVN